MDDTDLYNHILYFQIYRVSLLLSDFGFKTKVVHCVFAPIIVYSFMDTFLLLVLFDSLGLMNNTYELY